MRTLVLVALALLVLACLAGVWVKRGRKGGEEESAPVE